MKRPTILVTALCGLAIVIGGGSAAAHVERSRPGAHGQPAQPAAKSDIMEGLSARPEFSTLVELVKAAGLDDALKGKGPFTVFAPTNEAFARMPQGSVESLLKPESKARLVRVLKYHIIPARVPSADLIRLRESSKTLEGSTFFIFAKGGTIKVGPDERGAVRVSTTDTVATNGVVHTLDGVMTPPERSGEAFKAPGGGQ